MKRSQKETQISGLRSIFSEMSSAVLVDYRGLEVNQVVELRKKLNEVSSSMRVIKNTLARIAAKDTPFSELSEQFTQTRALIYGAGDPVEQAKVLTKAAQELERLSILSGILVGDNKTSLLSASEVEALSKLPSREELLVKLLFLMQAPARQFVRTLNEIPVKFVRTLVAVRESKS